MTLSILVIFPIPSHPQFQGNSARIFRLNQLLQLAGFQVHFLYFGMEGLTPESERAMRTDWDAFYFVQPDGPAPSPSLVEEYAVDDWFDDRIGLKVQEVCNAYEFDAVLVNYVWMSKALQFVPPGPVKCIDTHDRFAYRNKRSEADGVDARWFSTTEEQETLGLARADVVIAIQDQEAHYFSRLLNNDAQVLCVGHLVPKQRLLSNEGLHNGNTFGFLGSSNPFNIASAEQLLEILTLKQAEDESFNWTLCLAGGLCSAIDQSTRVTKYNFVANMSDLARDVDTLVNPMQGGTGLKIKSVDFLAFGRPVIATRSALAGLLPPSEIDALKPFEDPGMNSGANEHTVVDERSEPLLEVPIETFDGYSAEVRRQVREFIRWFY